MSRLPRRLVVVLLAILVLVSVPAGVAAAQTGAGGTIVVAEDETVSAVNAVAGSVVIHGTVTGDVSAAAGTVVITGTVDGDVRVATGNLRIAGVIGGDVSAGAGTIHLEESGLVGGNFDVGAGDVRIDGTIDGDARIGAEVIQLGEAAVIGGSLTYDGRLDGNRDAVAGDITRDRTIGPTAMTEFQPLPSWLFSVYAFIANLLLGAALLVVFPRFSTGLADRVRTEPLKAGLAGFGVLLGIPVLLVLLVLTIIGIPLALMGALGFVVVVWVGLVYGRFAVGMWVLGLAVPAADRPRIGGIDRKWVALFLGLAIAAVLAAIPFLGGLVNFLIFLLGLGGLALGLYARRRPNTTAPTPATAA